MPWPLAEQAIAVALKQAFLLAERLASAPFNVVQLAFIQAECCDRFPVSNALQSVAVLFVARIVVMPR